MAQSIWQTGRVRDFRGGETQAELPEEVGHNQLLRMENAMIFPTGWLTAAHQADTPVVSGASLGLAIVPQSNGTYTVYSANGDGNVWSQFLDTDASAPVDMPAGSVSAVADTRIVGVSKAVRFLGKDYCCSPNADSAKNGILNLTDMTLINVPGTGVSVKLRLYANRLWLLFSDGKLRISGNGDATTWDELNVLLLANSEPIVDFYPVPGGAIAYSSTAIYAMYGTTYTDITFIPLMQSTPENPKQFSSGSVDVGGLVFILSPEGVYQVALNGAQLIPHHQERYFRQCHSILSDPAKTVSAIHLRRHKAVMFTWPEVYGVGQSLVFYLSGAYSKVNKLLPTAYPYIIGMNDGNTDYLVGVADGTLAKSEYPSVNMTAPQPSIIQTRHEDANSYRDKTWQTFTIVTGEVVYGVTVQAVLDENQTVTVLDTAALANGENVIWIDDLPRSKTLSMVVTIDNGAVMTLCSDEDHSTLLTDDDGNELEVGVNPGNWTIKELKLRYREVGQG
jgi:hypothetical protein